MQNFTFFYQILNGTNYIFNWNLWIHTMLIKQVDDINFEALERGFGNLPDVLGSAIHPAPPLFAKESWLVTEHGGYNNMLAQRSKGFAHKFFVRKRAIHFSRVKECDTTLNSSAAETFRIEFFANSSADPSGYGEGQRYLGFANVATDGAGNATISTTLAASVAAARPKPPISLSVVIWKPIR